MDECSAGEPTTTTTRSDSLLLGKLQDGNPRGSNAALVQEVNSNTLKNFAGNKSDKKNSKEAGAVPTLVTTVAVSDVENAKLSAGVATKLIDRNESLASTSQFEELLKIGICTKNIKPGEFKTYSAKNFLHKLPSTDSIEKKFNIKSSLGQKIRSGIWAFIAVTILMSATNIPMTTTGWGLMYQQWCAQHYYLETTALVLMDEDTFTYNSTAGLSYNGTISHLNFFDRYSQFFPLGSNFSVYYDPSNPQELVLQPGVRTDHVLLTLYLMPVTFLWLLICFQPLFIQLDRKGQQLPVYTERKTGQESLDEKQDYIRARSKDSDEYRIVFDRDRGLSDIFPSSFFLALFIDIPLFWLVFFLPGKMLLIIFITLYSCFSLLLLKPKMTYVVLDIAGGIIYTECFKIELKQVTNVHLKISKNLDMVDNSWYRYSVNLVYRDKKSDLSKQYLLYESEQLGEESKKGFEELHKVIHILSALLKSDSCLPLREDNNLNALV